MFECQQRVIPPFHFENSLAVLAALKDQVWFVGLHDPCFRVMAAHFIVSERCDWYQLKAEVFPLHRLDEFVCIVTATQPGRREDPQKA